MKRYTCAVVLLAAVVVGLGAAGCSDDGPALTVEQYFEAYESLVEDWTEQGEALGRDWQEDLASANSEQERERMERDYLDDRVSMYRGFLAALDELAAPPEVEEFHSQSVQAGRELLEVVPDLYVEYGPSISETDWRDMFDNEELLEAAIRLNEACFGLQAVADENDIDVDLECPD